MSAALPSTAPQARILVAEPSRTLSALIRAALAELGAEIEMAPDGAAALTLARARMPDLLVCDQGLPGLDGYALAHALKQLAGPKKVATLLLVPDHATPDPERLAYVGISDVLSKPFERAVLLERVRGLLSLPSRGAMQAAQSGHAATKSYGGSLGNAAEPEHGGGRSFQPSSAMGAQASGAMPATSMSPAELEALMTRVVDGRLGALVMQRLPALLDGALARMLPQAVLEATSRAVAERVPAAVDNAARVALAEVATPARIDKVVGDIARASAERALGEALQPLLASAVEAVKARVEGELLGRLDHFARTELPGRLTSHAEQIVWKVVPTIAEDLVKEELKRLTAE